MVRHFQKELEDLKTKLIKMSSLAEYAISESIRALLQRQPEVAMRVVEADAAINALEIEIDDAVIDLLALQQPVAGDLRFILAALKINNDLERIGDHAVNIAESVINYAQRPPAAYQSHIIEMAQITKSMLREAIDGFIHGDPRLCRAVLRNDDTIDAMNRRTVSQTVEIMRRDPESIEQALELIRISRNLERVADLATNIAEDVIYVAEAQVVKHNLGRV